MAAESETCSTSHVEEMDDESDLASQRNLNEDMVRDGDVDVVCAPVLPFLKVPDRRAALLRAFKLPAGAVRDESAPRKTLGARRRKSGCGVGGFIAHKLPEASITELAAAAAAEEEETAPALDMAAPADAPPFQRLILWEPKEGEEGTAVEVEGVLCRWLREHQREGVAFMWECVHGLKPYGGAGCILADDMGLGKTLQSITLLYTVLRQGMQGKPTAKRAVVVCPTSLVANWDKEIVKWVGAGKVRVIALAEVTREKAIMDINTFLTTREYQVMIISYETFRIHCARFHAVPDACDLLICDEAHRLKNDATLTTQALAGLACRRRVLLSGTPMQNDLDEFWAMVDFTNPGVLGNAGEFRKRYANPILTAREPSATDRQKAAGDEASKELSNIVNQFILRRTNTLLSKHLPPKLLQIVAVRMSPMQQALYDHFVSSKELDLIMAGQQRGVLSCITALRKLVNHPRLIYDAMRSNKDTVNGGGRKDEGAAGFEDCEKFFPDAFHRERGSCVHMSGKFDLAARMLTQLRATTDDRIVIVSCYTQTLDIFQTLCREHSWPFIRLDGSTQPGKRQKLVDKFNDPKNNEFVFLLSSKAGGCGLNLIGANRLILFDPDWNPATDLQAAARVWRDGQRKKVYVYRFLAAGTLEEKVFQRQLSKKGLQTIVVEEADEVTSLSSDDLRNLFVPMLETACDTHDMLRCTRCRKPEVPDGESDAEIEAQRKEEAQARQEAINGVNPADVAAATAAAAAAAAAPEDDADERARKLARTVDAVSHVSSRASVVSAAGSVTSAPMPQLASLRPPPSKSAAATAPDPPVPAPAPTAVVVISDDDDDDDDPLARLLEQEAAGLLGPPPDIPAPIPTVATPAAPTVILLDEEPARMEEDSDDDIPTNKRPAAAAVSAAAPRRRAAAARKSYASDDDDDMDEDDYDDEPRAGSKRRRGAAKRPPARGKVAQRKAAKAAEQQRRAFEAAISAAIKESLAKPLDPVPEGTRRRQMKWPNEDDLKNWSHTMGVEGIADEILATVGSELVTFVFGLEVQGRDLSEFATVAPAARGKTGGHARGGTRSSAAVPASAAAAPAAAPSAAGAVASTAATSATPALSFAARRAAAAQARITTYRPPSATTPAASAPPRTSASAGSNISTVKKSLAVPRKPAGATKPAATASKAGSKAVGAARPAKKRTPVSDDEEEEEDGDEDDSMIVPDSEEEKDAASSSSEEEEAAMAESSGSDVENEAPVAVKASAAPAARRAALVVDDDDDE